MRFTIFCLTILLAALPATAAEININSTGTGAYPTIQDAIDAAAPGDVILLADGTYTGPGNRDMDYGGKGITIRSTGGAELCILDLEGSESEPHRGFNFTSAAGSGEVLEGVTITGGWVENDVHMGGSAVNCDGLTTPEFRHCIFTGNMNTAVTARYVSRPTFHDCLFTENSGEHGGATGFWAGDAEFYNCDFIDNQASSGGVSHGGHDVVFTDCNFIGNSSAYGAIHGVAGGLTCSGCLFKNNSSVYQGSGSAITLLLTQATITDCTFIGNTNNTVITLSKTSFATLTGCTIFGNDCGEAAVLTVGEQELNLINTVVAFNTATQAVHCPEAAVNCRCCDIFGNSGGDWVGPIADQLGVDGNISADPLFCGAESYDLTLHLNSPCAPFSPPNTECDLIGAWPVSCENTATEEVGWSRLKSLY